MQHFDGLQTFLKAATGTDREDRLRLSGSSSKLSARTSAAVITVEKPFTRS